MKNIILIILSIFSFSKILFSQDTPGAVYQINITDSVDSRNLVFGIDAKATDTIDTNLGEQNLPPFPPAGGFEARFILPKNNFSGVLSSYKDLRNANFPYTGQKEYRLKYQTGSGTTIIISWNFPVNVTGSLKDEPTSGTIINVNLTGIGKYTVTDPSVFDQLKMMISYNNVPASLSEENLIPSSLILKQNYPNPFNPKTIIEFNLEKQDYARLVVYNILGNVVKSFELRNNKSGKNIIEFYSEGLASGTYFYSIITSEGILQTKKMTILK
jgi:hypothetical protein